MEASLYTRYASVEENEHSPDLRQYCHNGNSSLTGKEHELVEKVKQYFLDAVGTLRLSVRALTLGSWAMGANSSTPLSRNLAQAET